MLVCASHLLHSGKVKIIAPYIPMYGKINFQLTLFKIYGSLIVLFRNFPFCSKWKAVWHGRVGYIEIENDIEGMGMASKQAFFGNPSL